MSELRNLSKEEMLKMRLDGATYQIIASKAGISRQRVQQLLSPPPYIRRIIVAHAGGKCQKCGIFSEHSGHVHHVGSLDEDYNDVDNLLFLCPSCHRKAHENEEQRQARLVGGKDYWKKQRAEEYAKL